MTSDPLNMLTHLNISPYTRTQIYMHPSLLHSHAHTVFTYAYRDQRSSYDVPQVMSLLFSVKRQGPSLAWSSLLGENSLSGNPCDPPVCLPGSWVKSTHHHTHFLMSILGIKPSPCVCKASISLTEMSPQLRVKTRKAILCIMQVSGPRAEQ